MIRSQSRSGNVSILRADLIFATLLVMIVRFGSQYDDSAGRPAAVRMTGSAPVVIGCIADILPFTVI
ncbi:hypothetical protein [Nitrosomonas communis]|uniref:Uncharacterized protein n=1 Tax=Nitrosomonas communis TaxID=44574 RepID=A0A0F7KFG6_9PROT|nr:hypothetical protein [Nitrosomonas communis]AKH38226.1 hypothetical protein AAW31_11195 [Nitrosomonas communis]